MISANLKSKAKMVTKMAIDCETSCTGTTEDILLEYMTLTAAIIKILIKDDLMEPEAAMDKLLKYSAAGISQGVQAAGEEQEWNE